MNFEKVQIVGSLLEKVGRSERGGFFFAIELTQSSTIATQPPLQPMREPLLDHLYLALAIFAEVGGTSALSASQGFSRLGPSAAAVVGLASAFYLVSLAMRTIPVGVAYATWAGAGVMLIALLGWLGFGRTPDRVGLLGLALIVAGVVLVNGFSNTGAR